MPRFSFERSSHDGLSSFKSPAYKAPLVSFLGIPAGLWAFLGGRDG